MLKRFYKFIVVNNSGQTLTYDLNGRLNLKMWAWHVDPTTGKLVYTQIADDDLGFEAGESIAIGVEQAGSEIDNTESLFVGLQVQLEVTHDAGTAATGTFDLYISTGDATAELESDATGYKDAESNELRLVTSLLWQADGLDDEVMRSRMVEVV